MNNKEIKIFHNEPLIGINGDPMDADKNTKWTLLTLCQLIINTDNKEGAPWPTIDAKIIFADIVADMNKEKDHIIINNDQKDIIYLMCGNYCPAEVFRAVNIKLNANIQTDG